MKLPNLPDVLFDEFPKDEVNFEMIDLLSDANVGTDANKILV